MRDATEIAYHDAVVLQGWVQEKCQWRHAHRRATAGCMLSAGARQSPVGASIQIAERF
jgi:hypothetical protein